MAGTVLKTDLQDTIEQQLRDYARNLGNTAQQVPQTVGDTFEDLQRAGRTGLQDVQAHLSDYATQAYNTAQQAAQEQAALKAQQAVQVQQQLTDYAAKLSTPQQPLAGAPATPPAGAPASLPHSEEPATVTDQVGGVSDQAARWKTQFDFGATYTGNYRSGTPHRGVDLVPSNGAGIGTEVDAFVPGTVTLIQRDNGAGGLMVYVQDNQGLTHAYMHLAGTAPGLAVGQQVQRGQAIAQMGESGTEGSPHLHYEVRKNAATGDPLNQLIDPRPYLSGGQPPQTAAQQPAAPTAPGPIDASSPAAFARSFAPYAKYAADKLGIDPTWVTAMAASESNYGKAPGNELFGVKGSGNAGTQQLATHEGEYGGVQTTGGFAAYHSPMDAVNAWVDLLSSRYKGAVGAADLPSFVHGLKQGGYFTAAEPEYLGIVSGIAKRIGGDVAGAVASIVPGASAVAGARRAASDVMQAGEAEQQIARAPIYGQTAGAAGDPMQQLTAIQGQLDALRGQLAGAPEAVRRTVEPYNQPPLAGAPAAIGQTLGGAFSELGGAAQQANRNLRTAIGGTGEPGETDTLNLGPSRGGGAVLGVRPPAFEPGSIAGQVERGQRDVRSLDFGEGLQYTGQALGAGLQALPPTYQALAGAKRQAIEAGNPLRDVFFAGGATSMLADAVTDPITWALPWGQVARGATELLGQVPRLAGVPAHIGGDALMNGLQNAAMEMAQPDPTPEKIAQAFGIGAGFGGVIRGVQSTPQFRAVGQYLLEQRGQGWPDLEGLLRTRQRGEVDLGLITGQGPTPPDPLHGMAVPRPGYEVGTPEHTTDQLLQDRARAQGTRLPNLTQADIQSLPGLGGSRMRGLQEVRETVEVGLPAARWYSEMVDQIKADTGQDINPREAAVLMGAFGGDAGVTANYHAMLSLFDALRQAKPDLTGLEHMTEKQVMATPAFRDVAALVHGDRSYVSDSMLARVLRGYRTGEIPVPSGAKLSSYTQGFLQALSEQYDPYSTQDVWQGRLFGSRVQGPGRGAQPIPGTPDVSGSDPAYRSMHALTNWVAREMNLPPKEAQAAGWVVFRTLWNDPQIGPLLKTDQISLSDALKRGQASGVLAAPGLATGGLAEVNGPRGVNTWLDKVNDVRDRIRQNGSYNTPPPDSATAINEWALYHPSVQNAAQARETGYGKVSGAQARTPPRPVGNEPAAALRDLALGDQPVLRVPGEVDVDPRTGKIPWLLPEHEVQRTSGGTYVTVAGVGDDAAHVIGRRLGADRFNHAEPAATTVGGVAIEGITSRAEQAQLVDALQARGLPVLREQAGTNLRVPLVEGRVTGLTRQVQDALQEVGSSGILGPYKGASHAVESGRTGRVGRVGPDVSAGRPLGVPAGDSVLDHPLAARLFRDAPGPGTPFGRQRGEVNVPFAANLGGAAVGGYAGYAATPEDATWDERLRNIGLGATAGLLGTAAITRGGGRLALARAGGAAERAEPFRAPGRPETPELRATTQEPPSGVPARAPRNLGEVRSNRYALREAAPDETPLTVDEMVDYGGELEQRLQDVQNRRDAIDELLRNPGQKPARPPWAAGYTNDQVAQLARIAGYSAFEPLWWEKAGLQAGSGEVRDLLREFGVDRGAGTRELTPAQLRVERTSLAQEADNIQAAYEQMSTAPAEPNLVRVRPDTAQGAVGADLPFDTGAPPEPGAAPVTEAGGGLDEGARLAQEIVLSKGRGTLRSDEGTVSLAGDVRSTALVSHEAVQAATDTPPSARTAANMPNLDAMLQGEPEIAAQIRKAAADNPDLIEAYRQGRISMDSLRNDLAKRVGMTVQDWNKTAIGKGFNPEEMMALQAAAVEEQGRLQDLGRDIIAKGGVDSLSPEELVFSAATLADAIKILAVARGARSTAGRTLNALKQRFDRTMASGITLANEQLAARRTAQQARRAATKATTVLAKGRELEREATTAKASASRNGAPRNIVDQIAAAYDELDRYNAMTLHEKGAEFDRLKAERAERAATRKERVRGAPEELLSALRAELQAEQDNFGKRKNTWETLAFWDTKSFENAMQKRTAFRGQLYIEQQRKVANIAAKDAEKTAAREFDAKLAEGQRQQAKAERLLEEIGGREVTRDLLQQFVTAMNDPSPDAAAKFLKGMAQQNNWARANIVRVAGLLSAPITHMINLGGNASGAMMEVPTRALTVGIDAFRAAITGGERQAYKAELLPMMQAYGPGMMGALPNALRALKTGINPLEAADLSKVRAGFASGSGAVDAAVEMPLRLLTAEDILFRSAATSAHGMRVGMREAIREGFRGEAAKGRAASILQNLEEYPELAKEVSDAAARSVFQERRALPLVGGQAPIGKPEIREAGRLAVSQVTPFVRTPTNIVAQGLGMSPLGATSALEAARGVREMPTGTRTERYARGRQVLLAEERAARAVVGTAILGTGLALGAAGMMTAGYPDDEQARSALPPGWRPWAFRLEDPVTKNTYYVPLQNLGPMGVPLAMAAILTDPTHRGKTIADPSEVGLAVAGIGKYVLDSTFLQGLSDFVDMFSDPGANAPKFLEGLVASYGPYSSLGRETQRATGVATRNPREGWRGLVDAMEANYPGISGDVPPARTPLGDERTQGATGAGRLIPYRYDVERDEPTLQVLRKTGIGIPKPPKAIGYRGGSIELTEAEQAQLQQMRGAAIRDMVPRVSENSAAVQKAVDLATASATKQFVSQLGADEVRRRWAAKVAPEPYYLGTATGT